MGSPRITPPRDGYAAAVKNTIYDQDSRKSSPKKLAEKNGNSPLQSFNSVIDRISPQKEKKVSKHLDLDHFGFFRLSQTDCVQMKYSFVLCVLISVA